jgi:hypothetical protein
MKRQDNGKMPPETKELAGVVEGLDQADGFVMRSQVIQNAKKEQVGTIIAMSGPADKAPESIRDTIYRLDEGHSNNFATVQLPDYSGYDPKAQAELLEFDMDALFPVLRADMGLNSFIGSRIH